MNELHTLPDPSLSRWQEAIQQAARNVGLDDASRRLLIGATDAYVMSHDPEAARLADPASRSIAAPVGVARDLVEASILYHLAAEKETENAVIPQRALERSARESARESGGIIGDILDALHEASVIFSGLTHDAQHPEYHSWKDAGHGDIDYSVICWKLPANGAVAILGDWGTGKPDATAVLRAACSLDPDAIIHLGDIYTTGTHEECEENVLRDVRRYAVRGGSPIPVFNLAGNHDYYSGGQGFHWLLRQLNSGDMEQPASYFCLRSEDGGWQFLAMDTGFDARDTRLGSHDREFLPQQDELEWLRHKLEDPGFTGNTILLSHHQPFSNFDTMKGALDEPGNPNRVNDRLMGFFEPYFDRIPLWQFGHEHDLIVYTEFRGLRRSALVGCSARPQRRRRLGDDEPLTVPTEGVQLDLSVDGHHLNHGFSFIKLNGAGQPADTTYYQVAADGNPYELLHEQVR